MNKLIHALKLNDDQELDTVSTKYHGHRIMYLKRYIQRWCPYIII